MKKKNGFTIVELVIVIGLLVVIAGLFSINMIKVMNKNKEDEIKNVEKQLISAADAYVTMDPSSIQKLYDGFSFVEIEVKTLRKYGLINDDMKDPKTGKPIPDEKKIRVSVGQNGELVFVYDPNTDIEGWDLYAPDLPLTIGEQTEYTDNDALSDLRTQVVLINSDSQVPKEEYYQGITIEYNNVNVNRVGQYRITYKFYDPSMKIYKMKDRRVFVKLPPKIEYTVNHYFMNLDGVTYTKKEEYTKKGIANYGTSITPERIETIGFITPDSQSIVLSQTSNTIDYYYDRESYTVTIDPNGGSYNGSAGVTNVKVFYGNSYTLQSPTRSGYEFMGWYINKDMTGGTAITNDTFYRQSGKTIYARWYKYFTVTKENRNMVGYKGVENEELIIPPTFENDGKWYKVTSIGEYAFYRCRSLTSITISDNVTSIGEYAFNECTGLALVTIPNSVTSIGYNAFFNCNHLTSISVNLNNKSYKSIDGVLFTKNGKVLIKCPGKKSGTYTIPNSVTDIEEYAFLFCSNLTSITIPDSVISIGNGAFEYCGSLTSVTIGNSVTSIGERAFSSCYRLAAVTIPNTVTSIGERAFQGCSSLTSVTIGNSVTSIGKLTFNNCRNLASVTIGNSVTSIGERAFFDCKSLTSVTIPNSVTSIGAGAFEYCSSLTSVTIGNSVTSIGGSAFYWCNRLTSINVPNSVTSIGAGAFEYCSSLTSVTIPDSVTSIGKFAFYECGSLKSISVNLNNKSYKSIDGVLFTKNGKVLIQCPAKKSGTYIIPNTVTNIEECAFYWCSSLTSVTIPDSVTSIGQQAFDRCSSLTSINIPNSVTSIGNNAFYNVQHIQYTGTATGSPWGAKSIN